ncbi:MAG: trypsin-like peptidase domain-containing protein [Opitutaceae bacterium]|nr:trypsin-like peptidase domain-containing protein [Opitutaceae bacterium]
MKVSRLISFLLAAGSLAVGFLYAASTDENTETVKASGFSLPIERSSVDRTNAKVLNSYSSILKQATPAVVSVHTAKIVKIVRAGSLDPQQRFFHRMFGFPSPDIKPEDIEERLLPHGIGSGVTMTADGYILTNNHVIADQNGKVADEILVQLNDGRELPAQIVGRDPRTDVAVLKIEATDLPSIRIASSENLEVGDIVFAIGNPLGIGLTVTQGIVSAMKRSIGIYGEQGYESFIQTDASINQGNSGGALVDSEGRLIGINSTIISQSGGSIGIGFAIPSDLALTIMGHLVDHGEVRRGNVGLSCSNLTADMAEAFGLSSTDGALVEAVALGLPADLAGIVHGDIIVAMDGKHIKTTSEIRLWIGQLLPGTVVEIEYIRNGERQTTQMTILDTESIPSSDDEGEMIEGVFIVPITDEVKEAYQLPEKITGMVIRKVTKNSGLKGSLREGMVILEVNGQAVNQLQDIRDQLVSGANKLYIYHRGQTGFLALRLP